MNSNKSSAWEQVILVGLIENSFLRSSTIQCQCLLQILKTFLILTNELSVSPLLTEKFLFLQVLVCPKLLSLCSHRHLQTVPI